MMTISGGSRGDAGAPKQTAARVFPPTPIVPTMSVARWACPAPSASRARASASPPPALVRYSAVRPAANLRTIADGRHCGCPLGRASGKHHQARITGRHDQAGTAGKRQN